LPSGRRAISTRPSASTNATAATKTSVRSAVMGKGPDLRREAGRREEENRTTEDTENTEQDQLRANRAQKFFPHGFCVLRGSISFLLPASPPHWSLTPWSHQSTAAL